MMSVSPNPKSQKAVTPDLLRCMAVFTSVHVRNNEDDHTGDLLIGGFFFAMRSCEICKTSVPGRTVMVRLGGVTFFDKVRVEIHQDNPNLLELSFHVRVLFEDQKNRMKMDTRSQKKTGDPVLCPVLRLGRAVKRVRKFVGNANDETPLCAINCRRGKARFITQRKSLIFIRKVCFIFGGKTRFGFHSGELGNRSIRSGAAMALFLKDHSVDKIMLLGRWKSRAFLVYIRPQIVEWTNLFSRDMVSFNNFFELCSVTDREGETGNGQEGIQSVHYDMPDFIS